ncbi:hypothetical protein JX266_007536 [Neoarthrinium moseri]|nr:hypothetical protein JX266_007536 [Neoarthrinium moseri]
MTERSPKGQGMVDEARVPLLASPIAVPAIQTPLPAPSHCTHCSWPWTYVVLLCITLSLVSDTGDYLYTAPRIRLLESVACTQFYLQYDPSLVGRDGYVPETLCKVDPVQNELASVMGWQLFFDSIPAILLPLPFGYLADRFGRKWILVLSMVGFMLTWVSTLSIVGVFHWPLRYVWLSSLFNLIGGGSPIGTTMLTTIVADVVPPELRSTVFFYRFCADMIAEFLVSPITSVLMRRNIWNPLLAAIGFQACAIAVALILPETLPDATSEQEGTIPDEDSLASSPIAETDDEPLLDMKSLNWLQRIKKSYGFVLRDAAVAALVLTFLFSKFGRSANTVLLQYASKRYGWDLAEAGLLLSLRAGVNLILYTIILPFIINFILSNKSAAYKDLLIGQASVVFMALGGLILFASWSAPLMITGLIVYTLGTGFPPVARSLVTYLVESHHESRTSDIGRLYALISVMEGVGTLLAGPGMAWAFRWGMSLGPAWLGIPFGFSSILFALIAVIVFRVKV